MRVCLCVDDLQIKATDDNYGVKEFKILQKLKLRIIKFEKKIKKRIIGRNNGSNLFNETNYLDWKKIETNND